MGTPALDHSFSLTQEVVKESCDEDIFIGLILLDQAHCLDATDILSRTDLTRHTFCWVVTSSSVCVSR